MSTPTPTPTSIGKAKLSFVEIKPLPDPQYGVPCTRSSHGISMVRGGTRLVLYGGEHVARTPLVLAYEQQALWMANLDADNNTWQWKCCIPEATQKSMPPPRVAHTQVAVNDKDVYVFGGRAGITMDEQPMNDLWKLDTETVEWTLIEASGGSAPSPRSFHRMAATVADDHGTSSLYIFGGCSADGRLADLYQFDLTTNTWHDLGASPLLRGRGGANLLVLSSQTLAVVAGFAGEETNDGQLFDVNTKQWQDKMIDVQEDGLRPRSVCVAGSFKSVAVLFGGEVDPSERGHEGAGGFENDVVLLDGTTGEYLETVRPKGVSPEARGWSDGTVFGNSLYIFGGLAGDDTSPRRLNDLWRLVVEEA
eukprot:CAMPEP_0119009630 /NCGR_PEP_ID=MMETSP1176-20130426/4499_1 /TAXON_ID=265551 /ORGANISM="Synedropsis recta cf, Strain CCMP1620" /LENGTH=363 /DNA_ID=CAMNT_0006962179 /DNA_START=45 /DNA_END=1136 /DNA_ORIENTATION=+